MLRRIASLAAPFLLAFTAHALPAQLDLSAGNQQPKTYVLYAAEAQTVAAGKPATLELRFHLLQGYHVNSHTPKQQFLIPTTLTLQPAAGVKAGEPEFPQGTPYSFSFDPTDKLDVYAHDFIIKLPVVSAAGAHSIDGALRYQACDNASCYPPKNLPIKVVFTAK